MKKKKKYFFYKIKIKHFFLDKQLKFLVLKFFDLEFFLVTTTFDDPGRSIGRVDT